MEDAKPSDMDTGPEAMIRNALRQVFGSLAPRQLSLLRCLADLHGTADTAQLEAVLPAGVFLRVEMDRINEAFLEETGDLLMEPIGDGQVWTVCEDYREALARVADESATTR
jgi:hypothetical protein